jgi:hypothetical protein
VGGGCDDGDGLEDGAAASRTITDGRGLRLGSSVTLLSKSARLWASVDSSGRLRTHSTSGPRVERAVRMVGVGQSVTRDERDVARLLAEGY